MGAIGGMLGLNGGYNGTGLTQTNATNGTQISNADSGVQQTMAQQQALLQALQGQGGLQNQSNVFNQLQGVANGTGPNPAQAMLNQATGANVANQAALMAGQRGASQNAGLIARQAAQQGAATQQQAAGQGATMQANQSLNALGQLGGLANTMAGQQIGQTNANTASQQGNQATQINAQGAYNNAISGPMQTQMQGQQSFIGGLMNSGSNMLSSLAEGGEVEEAPAVSTTQPVGPQSMFGQFLNSQPEQVGVGSPSPVAGDNPGADALKGGKQGGGGGGAGGLLALLAQGGKVPALVSPNEIYLNPEKVNEVKQGANPAKVGERIPGKAKVAGNSYANDTVRKDLEEGGIVIPRSHSDSPGKAAAFVRATLAKKGKK